MHWTRCLLTLFPAAFAVAVSAVSSASPQSLVKHDLTSITEAPRVVRRAPLPTITFGPASNYDEKPPEVLSLTGSSVTLVHREEPKDGADVFFAKDVAEKIRDTASKCRDGAEPSCLAKAVDLLDQNGGGQLEHRNPVVLVWVLPIVVAWAIGWFLENYDDGVHLPASDLAAISSLEASKTIVIATASNDENRITMTQGGSDDAQTTGVAISTASSGDVIISLEKELGDEAAELIDRGHPGCDNKKRDVDLDCVEEAAEFVMSQALPGGPLRAFVSPRGSLPTFAPQELESAVQDILEQAQQDIDRYGLNDDGDLEYLARLAFWIGHEHVENPDGSHTAFTIPASLTTSGKPSETSSAGCPPPDRWPNCPNCGNNGGKNGLCVNPWKGCPCIDGPAFPYQPFGAKLPQFLAEAQKILDGLPDISDSGDDGDDDAPFSCINGAQPRGSLVPLKYCQCGEDYKTLYRTATGETRCPYTEAPQEEPLTRTAWKPEAFGAIQCTFPSTISCATSTGKDKRAEPTPPPSHNAQKRDDTPDWCKPPCRVKPECECVE